MMSKFITTIYLGTLSAIIRIIGRVDIAIRKIK